MHGGLVDDDESHTGHSYGVAQISDIGSRGDFRRPVTCKLACRAGNTYDLIVNKI